MRFYMTFFMAVVTLVCARAYRYDYTFHNTPVAEALVRIVRDNPDLSLSFIYDDLDNYRTSARVRTDDTYEALRKLAGLNPVSVIRKGDNFYVEALQHGKFIYTGRAEDADGSPVSAATVMMLSSRDSAVVTYGFTDDSGRFAIPCDHRNVIAKVTCIGYRPAYKASSGYGFGTIRMAKSPVQLRAVKVEAPDAMIYADKSVFIPTARQKRASQTGTDLIDHLAIPQLGFSTGSVVTNSGKPVAVFIDFVPASDKDLQAMKVTDVKRVEYYESPSDPRLQGNPYVINFIMQQYQYGGYVKGFGHANAVSNSVGEALGNVRFQYRKMTYDLMGSAFSYDRSHIGSDLNETFRLPQPGGGIKEFHRESRTLSSKERRNWSFATFRAAYNTDNIQAVSQLSGRLDRIPESMRTGSVTYSGNAFPESDYRSDRSEHTKYLAYQGYYFINMARGNALNFTPSYRFSHTKENSLYDELGFDPVTNGASDNTHKLSGMLTYSHDFGTCGSFRGFLRGSYEYNRTRYTGSAVALDRAKTSRIGAGAIYSYSRDKFYGYIGFGWDWDRFRFCDLSDRASSPWFDLSLRYAFSMKSSISGTFHYSTWPPSPSYKSDKVIRASHLLSYTGNPALEPFKSYDFEVTYNWIPSQNFSMSAYGWGWVEGNRYVYDYEASSQGVLRTIKQPMGGFAQVTYGISGTLKLLDRSLVLSTNIGHLINHNGRPYNMDRSNLNWHARARYYLGDWNFTFTYISPNASSDGKMAGQWNKSKSDWYVTVGWSDDKWNIRGDVINFTRWNWRGESRTMRSRFYDTDEILINGMSRAFIQVAVTYTLGFGKKVQRDDQPAVSGSASSGILK